MNSAEISDTRADEKPKDAGAQVSVWPLVGVAVATGLICIALALYVDRPVALYMNEVIDAGTYRIWDEITKQGEAFRYFLFFLGIFLIARFMVVRTTPMAIAHWYANTARFALFGLVCWAGAGLLLNALKFVLGRARPALFLNDGTYGLFPFNTAWELNSFPSGHAQTVFTVATVLAFAMPRLTVPFFLIATLVASSRVVIGAHFVSDVIFGAFIGAATVLVLKKLAFPELKTLSLKTYRTVQSSKS